MPAVPAWSKPRERSRIRQAVIDNSEATADRCIRLSIGTVLSHATASMPEQELLAVDQRPDHVFPRLATILAAADVRRSRSSARSGVGSRAERGQIDLIEDLGITPARSPGTCRSGCDRVSSLLRTVSPLIIWNAWASVVDSDRSHSQVRSRSGLPNVFKNATPPDAPGKLGRPQRPGACGNRSGTAERPG